MISGKLLASVPEKIRQAATDTDWKIFTNVTDEAIEIRLDGYVGDEYTQSDAASIGKLLRANKGKAATLRVNSGGGLAFDGISIHNAMAEHDGPTTGIVESLAASAAAVAVLGCDKIHMHSNATFMIHESIGVAIGHAWEIRDLLEWMDRLDAAITDTIADRTGNSRDVVLSHMKGNGDGTVFSAQEALDAGYVHELMQPAKSKKSSGKTSVAGSPAAANAARFRHVEARLRAAHQKNTLDRLRKSG